jgi:hypothetical protein
MMMMMMMMMMMIMMVVKETQRECKTTILREVAGISSEVATKWNSGQGSNPDENRRKFCYYPPLGSILNQFNPVTSLQSTYIRPI